VRGRSLTQAVELLATARSRKGGIEREVGDHEYWVKLADDKVVLGGGFILTRRFVLTAAHCLRRLRPGSMLTVTNPHGTTTEASLEELVEGRDLALLRLATPAPRQLPRTGYCQPDDRWFAPYRPTAQEPHLGGSVLRHDVEYKCEGGDLIRAIQLGVSVELGDYSGYSGGPVERRDDVGGSTVVGLLIEQFPDRVDSRRVANVLFAAELGEALRCFEAFDVEHLLMTLQGREPVTDAPPQKMAKRWLRPWRGRRTVPRPPKVPELADIEAKLAALQRWSELALLPDDEVRVLRSRISQRLLHD